MNAAIGRVLFIVLLLAFAGRAAAIEWEERPDLGKLFAEAGVKGTFVLYDVAADCFIGHDRARAETRFIPASTFKLVNSLIGLSVGAVADVDSVLPYGGGPQPYKSWERDMGLREAIRVSNVPIYRELARRIGVPLMRENLTRIGYGNGDIGAVVDRFWLDGPLQISAIEQTRFLAALARGGLPFPAAVQTQVREIARLEQGDGWTLYGKTGWADSYDPDLGWWVGWVAISPRFWRPGCTHLPIRVEYRHAAVCRCGQATSAGQGLSESAWSFVNLFPPGGGASMSIAATPQQPYYAVIFTSLRQDGDQGYAEMARRMVDLARKQPGFLGIESVRDGLGITVSYWASPEAIQAWKSNAFHREAQTRAADWFSHQ